MPLNCKSTRVYGLVTVWKIDDSKRKKEKKWKNLDRLAVGENKDSFLTKAESV